MKPQLTDPLKKNKIKNLPAPYISPWSALKRDSIDLSAHILLKLRQVIRMNGEGSLLPVPVFIPKFFIGFFWPFSIISIFFLILLCFNLTPILRPFEIDLSNDHSIPYSTDSLPPPFKDVEAPKFNEESSLNVNPNIINHVAIDMDKVTYRNFLDKAGFSVVLIEGSSQSNRDNGLILYVGSGWDKLDSEKMVSSANQLQLLFEDLGYEELLLKDKLGHLIARTSRLGNDMIVFGLSES